MNKNIDPYIRSKQHFQNPPKGIKETLKQVGPGMILAGGVVGSGELIVTTKLGAVAGFTLLWFVLLSCIIKVVVQTELARYTICSGKTYLQIFNEMPGPAGLRPKWMTLSWLTTVLVSSVVALTVYLNFGFESNPLLTNIMVVVGFCAVVAGSAFTACGFISPCLL